METTKTFYTTVRKAKQDYWQYIINNIIDNKSFYKIIGWHKLAFNLKVLLLVINRVTIKNAIEKAETFRKEVLKRFNTENDLNYNPLQN